MGVCGGLDERCSPEFQAFKYLVPSWKRLGRFRWYNPARGNTSLETGFEIKAVLSVCFILEV